MIRILLAFALFALAWPAAAQDATESVRTNSRFLGVQANQLVQQLLNFGGTNNAVANPYLLTYAFNHNTSGTGMSFGLGYSYRHFNDGDAITPRQTTESDLFIRAGLEKKVFWGKRWMGSYGMDLVLDRLRDKTKTTSNFGGGGPPIETGSTTNLAGLGPRCTLNFQVAEKILIGTEASYYFKSGKQKIEDHTVSVNTEHKQRSFNLAVPSVLYLILRF